MMMPIRLPMAPFAAAVTLLAASLAPAQQTFAPNDPLAGDRTIARSVEIMALRADPVLLPRLYDASGEADPNFVCPPAAGSAFPCDTDGIGVERTAVLTPPTGYRRLGYDFDGVAADFDGDGKDEFAYAYEATDGYAYIRIADADDGVLDIVSTCCVRAEYPMQGPLHRRPIRLVAGEADGDPSNGLELILAYRFASAGVPGTAIEYFHVDPSTLEPTRYDATRRGADLNPTLACTGYANGLTNFDPVFDIALADLDEDGRDELILAQTARKCVSTSAATVVDDIIDVVVRSGPAWVWAQGGVTLNTELHTLSRISSAYLGPYLWSGVALAVGNFDASDTRPEVAVTSHRVGGYRWQYASIIGIDQSFVSTFGPEFQSISVGPFSGIDRRFDADAMDLDLSGRPELVTADGSDVRIFEVDPGGQFSERGSVRVGPSIGASVEETGLGRLMVGDLDASASSVFTPEIAVGNAWNLTIEIYRPRRDLATGTWSFDLIDAPRLAHELNSDVTLFPIDVDDDSVYLGSPTKTTAPSVFQPVVMLNSPPIHFDVFGNDVYDVSGCWDNGGCSHDSFYSISNGTEMAVTTEVRADWATSTTVSGSVGVELPFVQASVEASFETAVGDGFSKLSGSSNSFEMTVDALAYRSDWIFGTRSDYDIFEYPIYQGQDQTTPFSHVVSIVPKNTISVWTPSTDIEDLDVLQDHQTGNVLSYKPIANPLDPQENEAVKVNLPFGVGQTAFTISPNSSFGWALDFSQMTNGMSTQTSEQSVTAGVSASVSGGALGVTASFDVSTEGSYATGSVNTHETTVTTTSALDVTLGDLDGSLAVDGFQNGSNWANYTVKPYAYWSYSGALVVDFGVDLPTTANGVDSFWQTLYGDGPDFTFSMPLRNEMAKTGISQGNDLERRTRDILATPRFPAPGETVTIEARVQNYSLYDASVVDLPIVGFFWGDPAAAGVFLGVGSFGTGVTTIPARGDAIVRLADFVPPSGIDERSKIYVSIFSATGAPSELRSDNNISWNYAGFRSLPQCANGFDDDADGYVDFPDDPDCLDANGVSEVPEPGLAVSLAAGILVLARLRRKRPGHEPGRA